MEASRMVNAKRNVMAAVLLKSLQTVFPFIMRTVLLYTLGKQYLGLSSLFTSILQVLNLMELGVSSAMVYNMYRPIAENDVKTVNALLNLYRTYYIVIGIAIGAAGLCVIPFLNYLVKSDVPQEISLTVLYLMNLSITVISYTTFSYKKSLANALQRSDINSKVLGAVDTVRFLVQIVVLLVFKNYYIYYACSIVGQFVGNASVSYVLNKKYPQFKPVGTVRKEMKADIKSRVRALFISKLGGVVFLYADTLVISAFMGLVDLAHYQNYMTIMSAVTTLVGTVLISITASLGNSLISKAPDENARDLQKFTFVFMAMMAVCAGCFMSMYQPFMQLWMGAKDADAVLPNSIVVWYVVYFICYELQQFIVIIKDAAGAWQNDRFRPLVSSVFNLTLNIILVRVIGLYGIIISTVAALIFVEFPWLAQNLFTVIYPRQYRKGYVKSCLGYFAVIAVSCGICALTWRIGDMNLILKLVLCGLIGTSVPTALFVVCYHKTDVFRQSMKLVGRVVRRVRK